MRKGWISELKLKWEKGFIIWSRTFWDITYINGKLEEKKQCSETNISTLLSWVLWKKIDSDS